MLPGIPGAVRDLLRKVPPAVLARWAALLLPAFLNAQQQAGPDSAFLLTSTDPARTPSPFIGNGRLGVVVPALGVESAPSFLAGVYENAQGDVPRIVAIPAGNAVGIVGGYDVVVDAGGRRITPWNPAAHR